MKNIFKIHILYYLIGLIFILLGYFKNFIIFSSIIIIHECGHLVMALFFKWKIEKVILLPFGGITVFNEKIDKPLYQEFLIAIMGPIFQIIFYLIFKGNSIFNLYNKLILLFNLLPIYPLDGSKILNVILNLFFSFKLSFVLTIIISIILIILLCIINFDLVLYLILIFISIKIIKEIINEKYYFNKFLLERYIYENNYKKSKIIKSINKMKKQTNHTFLFKNSIVSEKEFLEKYFDRRMFL